MSKKKKTLEELRTIIFGDPKLVGPIYKEHDGKNIYLNISNTNIQFISGTGNSVGNHKDKIEIVLSNICHFIKFLENNTAMLDEYNIPNLLLKCAKSIEKEISDFLMFSGNRTDEVENSTLINIPDKRADVDYVVSIILHYCTKYIVTDDLGIMVYKYMDKYTEGSVGIAGPNEHQEYEIIDAGNRVAIMASIFIKLVRLIMFRTVSVDKINKRSLDSEVINKKLVDHFVTMIFEKCAYIYSSKNSEGIEVDYDKTFMSPLVNYIENSLQKESSFVVDKHNIFGHTDSIIRNNVEIEIFNLLFKVSIRANYKLSKEEEDMVANTMFENLAKEQGLLVDEKLFKVYSNNTALFGYKAKTFIDYIFSSLRTHIGNILNRKPHTMLSSVIDISAEDGTVSAGKDKVNKSFDIINKNAIRMKETLKNTILKIIIPDLKKDNCNLEIEKMMNRLKTNDTYLSDLSVKNPFISVILSERLDEMDIDVGNPLSYMNYVEIRHFIIHCCLWSTIKKFDTVDECTGKIYNGLVDVMLSKQDKNIIVPNYILDGAINRITEKVNKELGENIRNKHVIIDNIYRVISVGYKYCEVVSSSYVKETVVTLEEDIYIAFLKERQKIKQFKEKAYEKTQRVFKDLSKY